VKPIFGICLGNQLLALAAGAEAKKLPFGNRGQNQPVINQLTGECYITPQNHGFAIDDTNLPSGWKTLFTNINDKSNEGIMHETKPYFTAQFHPEAMGGPTDTSHFFDKFLGYCKNPKTSVTFEPRNTKPAGERPEVSEPTFPWTQNYMCTFPDSNTDEIPEIYMLFQIAGQKGALAWQWRAEHRSGWRV
jgi:hypothetical protein